MASAPPAAAPGGSAREPLVAPDGQLQCERAFYKGELRIMWAIGWPMAISFFCRFAMLSEDAAFVGHLSSTGPGVPQVAGFVAIPFVAAAGEGTELASLSAALALDESSQGSAPGHSTKDYLAAASLSDMVTQVIAVPLLAMGFGTGPLIGQALGAGNKRMAGTWTQLSVFCITITALPFLIAFFFVGDILQALGFHEDICDLAGKYAKISAIWVIPNCWFVAVRTYFQAQGMARPAMYSGLIFLGVNAFSNWLMVYGGPFNSWLGWAGFGFVGAAMSISLCRTLQFITYYLYMFTWRKAHGPTWPGVNLAFLRGGHIRPFLAQTLPQVGALLMQMLMNQCITLLVAKLGTLAVASSSAAMAATMPFTFLFTGTLGALAAMRVGFHLGSGQSQLAKGTAWMVLGLGFAGMSLFAMAVLPLRHKLMAMMTSDRLVQDLAADILPPVMLNFLFSALVQCATTGILASQGRTKLSTLLSLGFELPASLGTIAILVLVYRADVRVVYWAQAAASLVEACVVLAIVHRSDWERHAQEARARQRAVPSRAPPAPAAAPTGGSQETEVGKVASPAGSGA